MQGRRVEPMLGGQVELMLGGREESSQAGGWAFPAWAHIRDYVNGISVAPLRLTLRQDLGIANWMHPVIFPVFIMPLVAAQSGHHHNTPPELKRLATKTTILVL